MIKKAGAGKKAVKPKPSTRNQTALDQSAQEKLVQERQEIMEHKQRLTEVEKQLKESERVSLH